MKGARILMRGALAGFAAVAVGVGLAAGAVAYVSSDSDHGQRLPERCSGAST